MWASATARAIAYSERERSLKSHEILLETFNEIFTQFFIARRFHEILHHYLYDLGAADSHRVYFKLRNSLNSTTTPPYPFLSSFPFRLFPSLPFLSSHFPSCPFPSLLSLPLEVGPLNSARGPGERCRLPQRGLGHIPSRNRIYCIFSLKM